MAFGREYINRTKGVTDMDEGRTRDMYQISKMVNGINFWNKTTEQLTFKSWYIYSILLLIDKYYVYFTMPQCPIYNILLWSDEIISWTPAASVYRKWKFEFIFAKDVVTWFLEWCANNLSTLGVFCFKMIMFLSLPARLTF